MVEGRSRTTVSTKKALPPTRIDDHPISAPKPGVSLTIPIKYAFDHTNLKEIDIRWVAGSDSGSLEHVDVDPHKSGYLEIPSRAWKPGDVLDLEFKSRGSIIDQFRLAVDPQAPSVPKPQAAAASLHESGDKLAVTGPNFSVTVSRSTGLVAEAVFDNQVILKGGPYIDFGSGTAHLSLAPSKLHSHKRWRYRNHPNRRRMQAWRGN